MRDLVETVIDGILTRERMQAAAQKTPVQQGNVFKETLEKIQSQPVSVVRQGVQIPRENHHPDKKLWETSLKFEAQFIQQMMAAMRKSVPKSDFLPHGFAQDVQASMMDQAVADASSKRGDLGIAEAIYRQMSAAGAETRQQGIQEISKPADINTMEVSLNDPAARLTEVSRHAR